MEMTKKEMEIKIRELIAELAPEGTQFVWGRAKNSFGHCSYKKWRPTNTYFDFKITISYELAKINTWERVRLTVLHEIAHARTAGHGHDAVWKRECIAIGGDGKVRYDGTDTVIPDKTKKFVGTCPRCGHKFLRDRRVYGYCCDRTQPIQWALNLPDRKELAYG